MNIQTVYEIPGFLDTEEAYLLYRLASATLNPIVEIGTYYGRSTYVLGCGAKACNSKLFTIDPYTPCTVGEMVVSPKARAAMLDMLRNEGLTRVVTPIHASAETAMRSWEWGTIDLAFIDGSHEFEDVWADFQCIAPYIANGYIAFHDATGKHPGVYHAIDRILSTGEWEAIHQADSTVTLRRTK